jgi:hypothetical protein
MEPNSVVLLGTAAAEARSSVAAAARPSENGERRMAELASAALFEEALLGALRAHVTELRTVTR